MDKYDDIWLFFLKDLGDDSYKETRRYGLGGMHWKLGQKVIKH